jgi:predicted acyltransferase
MNTQTQRLTSLDIFRGITIASMLLVNNPGSWSYIYPPLKHAEWHGWTLTDLIFPFFLFIVGVAIKLSLDKYILTNVKLSKILWRILRRSLLLFILGLILHGFPYYKLTEIRIPGVLQRISLCYFFSALIYLSIIKKENEQIKFSPKTIVLIVVILLTLYYVLMTFVPVPGIGRSILSADRKDANLAAYIDRIVFTEKHLWKSSRTWDPEGLLSTIPAIGTTLTGLLCAWWIKQKIDEYKNVIILFVVGFLTFLSSFFCDIFMPINKSLWTPAYVLLSSGLAACMLAICYWFYDIEKKTFLSKPFLVFGTNAITVFFLSGLFARILNLIKISDVSIKQLFYEKILLLITFHKYRLASLIYAILFVLLWYGIISVFYKKKIFIKL